MAQWLLYVTPNSTLKITLSPIECDYVRICMDLRKTAVIFLCTINWLAFITEKQRTYCAGRAQILNKTNSSLIACFCSYVEHSAFMKFFHLVPSRSSPSAVPVLLFFSRFFLIYPSSVYPECFGPMRVFLLHLVVYVLCGQSKVISFLYFLFSRCSCSLGSVWSIQRHFFPVFLVQ
jgi:hypothetical protein